MGVHIVIDSLRVYIKLDPMYMVNIRGLCGTFNAKSSDDWMTPEGLPEAHVVSFADSYRVTAICETKEQYKPCVVFYGVSYSFIYKIILNYII